MTERGRGRRLLGVRLRVDLVELPTGPLGEERSLASWSIDDPIVGEPIRAPTISASVSRYGGPLVLRVTRLRGSLDSSVQRIGIGTVRVQRRSTRI
jgi:hypothetical protein